MTRVWLSEIHFSDNTKIGLNENDIVVLVGPNNSGKSATLKEAATLLRAKNSNGKVLKDIKIEKIGDEEELINFKKAFWKRSTSTLSRLWFQYL